MQINGFKQLCWSSLLLDQNYLGRITLVSHGEYAHGTDEWTDVRPLHYTTLSTRCGQQIKRLQQKRGQEKQGMVLQ